jgi:hypothetical protein
MVVRLLGCILGCILGLWRAVCPRSYLYTFCSAHSVCSVLIQTPLNVPRWAPGPLAKVKRASGKSLRNLGSSTVRPTTPLVDLVLSGTSRLFCHRLELEGV